MGLPGDAHSAISDFCDQQEYLELMSTSSAARATFGAYFYCIDMRQYRADEKMCKIALWRLLRWLPNLESLSAADEPSLTGMEGGGLGCGDRPMAALAYAIASGGCCGKLLGLDLKINRFNAEDAVAFGAAIATGNLPSLEEIEVCSRVPQLIPELSTGLRGGASPRLASLELSCHREGLVALVEALEARMALDCCHVVALEVVLEAPGEDAGPDPDALRRVFTSPALAKLKKLHLYDILGDSEVRPLPSCCVLKCFLCACSLRLIVYGKVVAVSEALQQLKPQELCQICLSPSRARE
jgi:hypothetical protein